MGDILIVTATRLTKRQFEKRAWLAPSLRRMRFEPRIESAISFQNKRGLPSVFNRQIAERNRKKILVFTHDDVRIDDFWLGMRLDEGLRVFDVIGVAGNRRRMAKQPGWGFNVEMRCDKRENLSGGVCHYEVDGETVSYYGEARRRCKLLDGVFLAARASTLLDAGVRFDAQFRFHFYDMDFCRSAEQQGLRMGTWPIALTHASGGAFGSPAWQRDLARYQRKWRD